MADEPLQEQIDTTVVPSGPGCAECSATGAWWVHLRRCAACGHVGCCDDSLHRHARAHARRTGHRFIQSFEPGEQWFWDFESDQFFSEGPSLMPPASHPADQPAPGPEGRVPADWVRILENRNIQEPHR